MSKTEIINIALVNEADEIIGYDEKLKVHLLGLLHRAFSVLIFNRNGEMLIHQRAFGKYHSPGLWTNACCGHPNEGDTMQEAARRRLGEEMGFDCDLEYKFTFKYHAEFDNGLTEHEIDHVFYGEYNDVFVANPEEVADFKWMKVSEIREDIKTDPESYSVWFREILDRI
ncbi:MAG: isopentenyl-diphosphate delta-isomerase [Arcticibacterium sp.]|jgi:isopentenyl-diphosphate delta-isomerase